MKPICLYLGILLGFAITSCSAEEEPIDVSEAASLCAVVSVLNIADEDKGYTWKMEDAEWWIQFANSNRIEVITEEFMSMYREAAGDPEALAKVALVVKHGADICKSMRNNVEK